MTDLVFANARVVLADRVLDRGSVLVRHGLIAAVDEGGAVPAGAMDCEGALLLPGLVELHTDHLEQHFRPRPKVTWPAAAAVQSHDAQIAGCAITTVFDALRVGTADDDPPEIVESLDRLAGAIGAAQAGDRLRADHHLHLRCELACPNTAAMLERYVGTGEVRLVSVMDHTPGQRQFVSIDAWRTYFGGKRGLGSDELDRLIVTRRAAHETHAGPMRAAVLALAKANGIAVASHDDATAAHVDEAVADGVAIAEFPTTAEAARLAHGHGLKVLMGAPNVVRGRSHSGNVAAAAMAAEGVVDILSSDYVPSSLLHSALLLARDEDAMTLPRAVAMVTSAPADAVGLTDRGRIATGLRADLAVVADDGEAPVVRSVWRTGRRVA